MTLDLPKPAWWSKDVEFDPTGKTQLEWAKEAAAAYRAAHPERYGGAPSVTPEPKSVTPSVTNVTEEERSVTVSKGALRAKRWRERKRTAPEE